MLLPNKRKGGPTQNESPEKVIKDNPLLGAILDSSDETRDMHSITPEKQVESPIKENQNNNKVENTSSDMGSQEDFFGTRSVMPRW